MFVQKRLHEPRSIKFIKYIQQIMGMMRKSSFLNNLLSVSASTATDDPTFSTRSILRGASGEASVLFLSGVLCPEVSISLFMLLIDKLCSKKLLGTTSMLLEDQKAGKCYRFQIHKTQTFPTSYRQVSTISRLAHGVAKNVPRCHGILGLRR